MRRAWEMIRASWRMLTADRTLVALAVAAHLVALLAGAVTFFVGVALAGYDTGDDGPAVWIVAFVVGVVTTFISTIGQGAIMVGASRRMDGHDPRVSDTLDPVRRRLGAILAWSVIGTVVNKVLDLLRRRDDAGGRAASAAGGFAWRSISFLALPVIVFEEAGAGEGLRRSSALLKETWGENLAFNVGLGLLGVALTLPAVAVLAVAGATGVLPLSFLGAVPLLVYGLLAVALYSALSAVLKTVLYRWACNEPVDRNFSDATLEQAFTVR